jgi:stage II sporulation protein D
MISKRKLFVVVLALMVAACSPGTRKPVSRGDSPWIRALVAERSSITVEVTGAFHVESGGMELLRSKGAGSVEVTRNGRSLQVRLDPGGSVGAAEGEITVVPASGADVSVSDTPYAGRVVVRPGKSSKLLAINVVPLETYLEGVVPHEIGNPGPEAYAALQAQAITARTYALSRIDDRRGETFDVFAGVRDQVYRGKERSHRATSAAVRDTRGVVLAYGGSLARTN